MSTALTASGNRVCLVTEELSGVGSSGGIGAAFLELAQLLANQGMSVDVLYCPIAGSLDPRDYPKLSAKFAADGIKLSFLDAGKWVVEPLTYEKRAYAIARHFMASEVQYDFIHFHDYKGLGFFCTSLKRQGLAFAETRLVVQLHGPTRWTIDANQGFFSHEDQLKIDHMERLSIAQADCVVSPSAYLLDWMRGNGFELPADARVIKNVCSNLSESLQRFRARLRDAKTDVPVSDIVFFARHEDRKGFAVFCDALELIKDELAEARVTVTFLGKFGMVDNCPSGVLLIDRARQWRFPVRVRSNLVRNEAVQYILSRPAPLVVIPSPAENSPYTVLESIMLSVPVISSLDGGGPELFADQQYPGLCQINSTALSERMLSAMQNGLPAPVPSETGAQIDQHWLQFHERAVRLPAAPVPPMRQPRVTFAITHHERPKKLVDAILSAVCQTYSNFEILVVDDGSKSEATLADLRHIEGLLDRVGGRLVRQENAYLGAARNTAVREATGEFICFLDDDDIAMPELVQTLVTAIVSMEADAVNCMNLFMEESVRSEVLARSDLAPTKVHYVPLGGPLSLAPTENCLGAATAIFRRSALLEIGGYSEIKGVGHEDYELYLRLVQAGKRVSVVPMPLYYYEVGRPSMLSRTSLSRNFRRCFDVVDTRTNSDAWRDVVGLNVGKGVAINAHNRQWWLASLTKTAELRHRLLAGGLDRADTLRTLMALAGQESVPRLQAAFAEDLALGTGASTADEAEDFQDLGESLHLHSAGPAPAEACDPEVLELRLNLTLGRHEDAVRRFTAHLAQSRKADDQIILLVRQLIGEADESAVTAEAWAALAKALRGCRVPKAAMATLSRVVLVLAMKSRDADMVRLLLTPELKAAETRYLAANADVETAVRQGDFESGLDHYLQMGKGELRKGFEVLAEVDSLIGNSPELADLVDDVLASMSQVRA